jgi:hypothetical protein
MLAFQPDTGREQQAEELLRHLAERVNRATEPAF